MCVEAPRRTIICLRFVRLARACGGKNTRTVCLPGVFTKPPHSLAVRFLFFKIMRNFTFDKRLPVAVRTDQSSIPVANRGRANIRRYQQITDTCMGCFFGFPTHTIRPFSSATRSSIPTTNRNGYRPSVPELLYITYLYIYTFTYVIRLYAYARTNVGFLRGRLVDNSVTETTAAVN